MTGQVKEEILTRFAELGLLVDAGSIRLEPCLIEPDEMFGGGSAPPVSPQFSLCQTPVTVSLGAKPAVRIVWADGRSDTDNGLRVGELASSEVFARSGAVERIEFTIDAASIGLPAR